MVSRFRLINPGGPRRSRERLITNLPTPQPTPWWDQRVPGTVIRAGEIIAVAAGLGGLIYAGVGLHLTNIALEEQRQIAFDQTLTTAYQLLITPSPSSASRKYAIRTILPALGEIAGFDGSCRAVGLVDNAGKCLSGPNLDRIELNSGEEEWNFAESSLADNSFYFATLKGVSFISVDLSRTSFAGAAIEGGTFAAINWQDSDLMGAKFSDTVLGVIDFQDSRLFTTKITATYLDDAAINLSGSKLCMPGLDGASLDCLDADPGFYENAWFWTDNPPAIFGGISAIDNVMVRGCARPPQLPEVEHKGMARRIIMSIQRPPDECQQAPLLRLGDAALR